MSKTGNKVMAVVMIAALLIVSAPVYAAAPETGEVGADANVMITRLLGPYALTPLDPVFNLFIISLLSLLSGHGAPISPSVTQVIRSNPLFASDVLCYIMLGLCLIMGILSMVCKYIPGVSAAAQATLQKFIDYSALCVTLLPYAALFLPQTKAYADAALSTVPSAAPSLLPIMGAVVAAGQFLSVRLSRASFDMLMSLSPTPVTTLIVDVVRKFTLIALWVVAFTAPWVLIYTNAVIFALTLLLSRKALLFSHYCTDVYVSGLWHMLRGKKESVAYMSAKLPRRIHAAHPQARICIKVYARRTLGGFTYRLPINARCYLIEDHGRTFLMSRSVFYPGWRDYSLSHMLTCGGTVCVSGPKIRFSYTQKGTGYIKLFDASRRYESILPDIAALFGLMIVEPANKEAAMPKATRRKKGAANADN